MRCALHIRHSPLDGITKNKSQEFLGHDLHTFDVALHSRQTLQCRLILNMRHSSRFSMNTIQCRVFLGSIRTLKVRLQRRPAFRIVVFLHLAAFLETKFRDSNPDLY